MSEKYNAVYPKGVWFNAPHPSAPTFIVGNISVDVEKFKQCLEDNKQYVNKGYLKLNVLKKQKEDEYGKYNLQIDTWASSNNKTDIPMKEDEEIPEISLDELPNF